MVLAQVETPTFKVQVLGKSYFHDPVSLVSDIKLSVLAYVHFRTNGRGGTSMELFDETGESMGIKIYDCGPMFDGPGYHYKMARELFQDLDALEIIDNTIYTSDDLVSVCKYALTKTQGHFGIQIESSDFEVDLNFS